MKFTATVATLALAAGVTDAFVVNTARSQTVLQAVPGYTGGVEGASFLPESYERVDVDAPWGGKNWQHPDQRYGPQPAAPNGKAIPPAKIQPTKGYSHPNARMTGGVDGSSMIPGYELVAKDAPWGKNPWAEARRPVGDSKPQVLPASAGWAGSTGGHFGSAMIPDRVPVSIDAPWGYNRHMGTPAAAAPPAPVEEESLPEPQMADPRFSVPVSEAAQEEAAPMPSFSQAQNAQA